MGPLKAAAVPCPSHEPETPTVPAIVETVPVGVIFRIVELVVSATKIFPTASIQIP